MSPPDPLLYEALDALRRGAEGRARQAALTHVQAHLDARFGHGRDHDDARQITLIKVLRGVGALAAHEPRGAAAWLHQVHRRVVTDLARSRRRAAARLEPPPRDGDEPPYERLAAPEPDAARTPEAWRRLGDALADALDAIADDLDRRGLAPLAREAAFRNAQLALLVQVGGLDLDEVVGRMGLPAETPRTTLYKWVERGRERVCLPAVEAWIATGSAPPWAPALRDTLVGARRADAGAPRPSRRKDGVSPPAHRTSVQSRGGPTDDDTPPGAPALPVPSPTRRRGPR